MTPASVGVTDKHSCSANTPAAARSSTASTKLGHTLSKPELDAVYHRFTELADRKKSIYDQDILALLQAGEGRCSRHDVAAIRPQTQTAGLVKPSNTSLEGTTNEAQDCSPRRRRHRPRSHPRSRQHPAGPSPSSAATTSPSPRPSSAASPSPPQARRCPQRPSTPRSSPTPSCSARSATTSSTPSRPTSAPRPACCRFARRSAASPTCALRSPIAALAANSPLRPEVTKDVDILFVRELLGGLYFGQPRCVEQGDQRSHQHHALHPRRGRPRRAHRLRARAASAARSSPRSTRPTSSRSRSSGAPPSPRSPRTTPTSPLEHQLVDSMAMHLMNIPRNFDVVLTENLFGDILSDEAGVITGSLGMLPSATIGGKVNLYEPVHGSAPDIAGTGQGQSARRDPHRRDGAAPLRRSRAGRARHRSRPSTRFSTPATAPPTSPAATTNAQLVTTQEMGKLVHQALAESIDQQPGHARRLRPMQTASTHPDELRHRRRSHLPMADTQPIAAGSTESSCSFWSTCCDRHAKIASANAPQLQLVAAALLLIAAGTARRSPPATSLQRGSLVAVAVHAASIPAAARTTSPSTRASTAPRPTPHRPQTFWGTEPADRSLDDHRARFPRATAPSLADDNRYLTVTGCVPHFCPARGLLWVDLGALAPARRLRRGRLDQPSPTPPTKPPPTTTSGSSPIARSHADDLPLAHSRASLALGRAPRRRASPRAAHRRTPRSSSPTAHLRHSRPRSSDANTIARSQTPPHRRAAGAQLATHNLATELSQHQEHIDHTANQHPRTMFEKVWQQHLVAEPAGEPTILYIDLQLVHEVTSPQAFDGLRLAGRKLRRPDRHIATVDHNVPTTSRARPPRSSPTRSPPRRSTRCARTAPSSASSSSTCRTPRRASST